MPFPVSQLKRRRQFLRTASSGLKWVTPGMIVQARRRIGTSPDDDVANGPRLGLTVSKKVGNAVQRNRARRRLRAVANDLLPQIGLPELDYVLIGRQTTLTRPFDELTADLELAVERLNRKAGRNH